MNKKIVFLTIAIAIMVVIFIGASISNNSGNSNSNNSTGSIERLELPDNYYKVYEEERERLEKEQREQRQRELENKWKKFAGRKYEATTLVANFPQHFAFSYDESGHGKYIIFTTYPGTDVVEKMIMEADIYSVTSDGDYLYLYIDGLRSPAKVKISGNSLYTAQGEERYYIWD